MKILTAGMSGLLGRALISELRRCGHQVLRLVRQSDEILTSEEFFWDAASLGSWIGAVEESDAIVNFSGEPIDKKPWTSRQKKEIVDSRIRSTRVLVQAMERAKKRPTLFLNASAIGNYGDRNEELLDERSACGAGFLAEVCDRWEVEAFRARTLGIRVAALRSGVVLAAKGGVLARLIPLFKAGLGGNIGTGFQFFGWIHIRDHVNATLAILNQETYSGAINLVAPKPSRMGDLTRRLATSLRRPHFLPCPSWALKGMLGERADLFLGSQRVSPKRLMDGGFAFAFPDLESALKDLLHP